MILTEAATLFRSYTLLLLWIGCTLLLFQGCGAPDSSNSAVFSRYHTPPRGMVTRMQDQLTAARVKAALVRDDLVDAGQVTVDVFRGVVTISGRITNTAMARMAVHLVRGVDGVVHVTDRMVPEE